MISPINGFGPDLLINQSILVKISAISQKNKFLNVIYTLKQSTGGNVSETDTWRQTFGMVTATDSAQHRTGVSAPSSGGKGLGPADQDPLQVPGNDPRSLPAEGEGKRPADFLPACSGFPEWLSLVPSGQFCEGGHHEGSQSGPYFLWSMAGRSLEVSNTQASEKIHTKTLSDNIRNDRFETF